jgi:ubiquinone biosynthesis protein UbiJ
MTISKAGAFLLAVAVDVSPEDLLKWFAGAAVAVIVWFVLREVDRFVKAAQRAEKAAATSRSEVAALRTEVAVLKQRVSHLEAQGARRSPP